LIAAGDFVVIDIVRPGIQRVGLDDPIGDSRSRLVRRKAEWRPAQLCGFGANPDLACRCFLLQLGGNVHGRSGDVEASDGIFAAYA